jgi:hypothetical protein
MKKISILVLTLLTAFNFQCSDSSYEPTQAGMTPGLKEEVTELSLRLNAIWVRHCRSNSRKALAQEASIYSTLNEARAALDLDYQAYFDATLNHPEMKKMINWVTIQFRLATSGGPLRDVGRTSDMWDFGTVVSEEAQERLNQLHIEIDNTLAIMEG